MKGLRLYIPPFAPDDSGAASVLFPLGGIVVICDAGGCAGNISGFDEPRWSNAGENSAMFSAGLRDMDAIMGRDDRLIKKLALAAEDIKANFAAIIGTPVPAVIGTDFAALKRMAAKKLNLPVIALPTDGTHLYDDGAAAAFVALFQEFAVEANTDNNAVGVLGVTPLDFFPSDIDRLKELLATDNDAIFFYYGIDRDIEHFRQAGGVKKNLVASVAGLPAAKYLKQRFGTPYEIFLPPVETELPDITALLADAPQKILIIHEQFRANALRRFLAARLPQAEIICGTWFRQEAELAEPNDIRFTEEDDFISYVMDGNFDAIIGDPVFALAIPNFSGQYIPLPHFAVSGSPA